MSEHAVEAHETTHTAAANRGMLTLRQCWIVGVNIGLEFAYKPVHIGFASTFNATKEINVIGAVFDKAHISLMVAVLAYDNVFGVGIEPFFEPPAGAIGCYFVIKEIVAVIHIEHGVAFSTFVIVGKIEVDSTIEVVGGNVSLEGSNQCRCLSIQKFSSIIDTL